MRAVASPFSSSTRITTGSGSIISPTVCRLRATRMSRSEITPEEGVPLVDDVGVVDRLGVGGLAAERVQRRGAVICGRSVAYSEVMIAPTVSSG